MARIARITIPGVPHHVTQRGNRKQNVFFSDADRRLYLQIIKEQALRFGLKIWAYCLMSNHVHFIVVPETGHSLSRGLGEAHRRYTRIINRRKGWTGFLWQGRFASYPLDEKHLYAAIRYVERNPVRAKIAQKAEEYPWSSACAHVHGQTDSLLSANFLTDEIKDWADFLQEPETENVVRAYQKHLNSGRPLGDEAFVRCLEAKTGRTLQKQKPGRAISST